ncbi:WhiB family transcriptional regulator [bacterium]|nr:WhiB family transcriptional regulator [Candidatus Elulimicrobium humile]
MHKLKWKDSAACVDYDTNIFFEKYEDDELLRPAIDKLCSGCPVSKICFAVGVSTKEYGVWGGIYLESGEISKEFNSHKTEESWAEIWKRMSFE